LVARSTKRADDHSIFLQNRKDAFFYGRSDASVSVYSLGLASVAEIELELVFFE